MAQALAWSDKHRKLTSEGARVVHIKHLLTQERNRVIEEFVEWLGRSVSPRLFKGLMVRFESRFGKLTTLKKKK